MAESNKVEHEKSAVAVLTTAALLKERPLIVEDVVELPDPDNPKQTIKHKVKVRRGNVAEIFTSFNTFSLTKPDDTDTEETVTEIENNQLEVGIQVMQETVILFMEEPKFRYAAVEGEAYPIESLTQEELNAFYNVVNKTNNPEEVDRFFASFRGADTDGTGTEQDNPVGQESATLPPETESADTAPATD